MDMLKNDRERGSTLMLVLGVVLVMSVLIIPLTAVLRTSINQSVMAANSEKAGSHAESIARVYRKLLQEAAGSGLKQQDLRLLAQQLADHPLAMDGRVIRIRVLPDEPAPPDRIEIITESGSGPSKRQKKIIYHFSFSEGGGPGGAPGGDDDVFYLKKQVVVSPSTYNFYFKICDKPGVPDEDFFDNDYPPEKFAEDFLAYLDYFLQSVDLEPLTAPVPGISANAPNSRTYNNLSGTVNETVDAKGNIIFNSYLNTVTINGDVVAGGDITFNGIGTLVIKGDLIAGGNIDFKGWTGDLTVEGNIGAKNLTFAGGNNLTVGKWNTNTNQILDNSFSSIIVAETFKVTNTVQNIRVSGDFSAGNFNIGSMIGTLRVGGNMISGGNLDWHSTLSVGEIGGSLKVANNFNMQRVDNLRIGESLIVGNHLAFGNEIRDMLVGGSIVSLNNVTFHNNIAKINVSGDFLVKGTMEFKIAIKDWFQVGGMLAILNDLIFKNHLPYTEDLNRFGGFYVGGVMDALPWINQSKKPIFCIDHNPPEFGGGGSAIDFNTWISG